MDYGSFHKTILAENSLFNTIHDGLSGDCSRMGGGGGGKSQKDPISLKSVTHILQ